MRDTDGGINGDPGAGGGAVGHTCCPHPQPLHLHCHRRRRFCPLFLVRHAQGLLVGKLPFLVAHSFPLAPFISVSRVLFFIFILSDYCCFLCLILFMTFSRACFSICFTFQILHIHTCTHLHSHACIHLDCSGNLKSYPIYELLSLVFIP